MRDIDSKTLVSKRPWFVPTFSVFVFFSVCIVCIVCIVSMSFALSESGRKIFLQLVDFLGCKTHVFVKFRSQL